MPFGRTAYNWENRIQLEKPMPFGRTYAIWENRIPLGEPHTIGKTHAFWENRIHLGELHLYNSSIVRINWDLYRPDRALFKLKFPPIQRK